MALPDDIGTPGPWKAAGYRGHPVTRKVLALALKRIASDGPLRARNVGEAIADLVFIGMTRTEKTRFLRWNGDRVVDITIQLLKRWGLIRYRKGAGWEVVA